MLKIFLSVFIILFFITGYLYSDDIYYAHIISQQKLTDPEKVFNWVTKNFTTIGVEPVHHNASPLHLLKAHKGLFCDEGAIVMATLDHKLGYETHLVDLYGKDNVSHHTVLVVKIKNKWVNNDFTSRYYNMPLDSSAKKLKLYINYTKNKPYPQFYNFCINNNYFIKKIVFLLRNIEEHNTQHRLKFG